MELVSFRMKYSLQHQIKTLKKNNCMLGLKSAILAILPEIGQLDGLAMPC